MEIERKYLLRSLPDDLEGYPHVEIEQAYLCTSPTLRIRRMGDTCILTVKENLVPSHRKGCPSGGVGEESVHPIVNREEEFLLSEDSYQRLKSKCEGGMVEKTRYRIPLFSASPLTAELDIFHGIHEGLRLVEVEFPDIEAADSFVPPSWFGPDVSSDPHYRNSYLSSVNS